MNLIEEMNFKKFYDNLINKHNIWYIFFTDSMLFWLIAMLENIPSKTNIVLIGADLEDDEKNFVVNLGHPFFI